jgi:NADH-quinone oxidoreductase subunit K
MTFFVSPHFVDFSTTILFFLGVAGVAMNRRSILLVLMSVELILLAVNIKLVISSIYLDDIIGQVFSLFVLTVAAAESSIGLAILVAFFRTRGSIMIYNSALIRGLFSYSYSG